THREVVRAGGHVDVVRLTRATSAVDRRSGRLPFRFHAGYGECAALRIGDRAVDVTDLALRHRATAECDDDGENRCDSNVNEVRSHHTSPHLCHPALSTRADYAQANVHDRDGVAWLQDFAAMSAVRRVTPASVTAQRVLHD